MSTMQVTKVHKIYGKGVVEPSSEDNSDKMIPSPPLSPSKTPERSVRVLNPGSSYPLASLQKYTFQVNAWDHVNEPGFASRCLDFLSQYFVNSSKRELKTKKEPKRAAPKRRTYASDTYESSTFERVRTRRVTKEKNHSDLSISDSDKGIPPSPPKKRKTKEHSSRPLFVDWESLPDYSPSVDTLPASNKCLSTEWKGQPMDLSEDPSQDKLHPAELVLASILRLPCNVYLDLKRRLFMEKVARLKKGLPFRRTDAQKACRIDVNKASRLFASFEKAGWLKDEHFERYI